MRTQVQRYSMQIAALMPVKKEKKKEKSPVSFLLQIYIYKPRNKKA